MQHKTPTGTCKTKPYLLGLSGRPARQKANVYVSITCKTKPYLHGQAARCECLETRPQRRAQRRMAGPRAAGLPPSLVVPQLPGLHFPNRGTDSGGASWGMEAGCCALDRRGYFEPCNLEGSVLPQLRNWKAAQLQPSKAVHRSAVGISLRFHRIAEQAVRANIVNRTPPVPAASIKLQLSMSDLERRQSQSEVCDVLDAHDAGSVGNAHLCNVDQL